APAATTPAPTPPDRATPARASPASSPAPPAARAGPPRSSAAPHRAAGAAPTAAGRHHPSGPGTRLRTRPPTAPGPPAGPAPPGGHPGRRGSGDGTAHACTAVAYLDHRPAPVGRFRPGCTPGPA